MFTSVNSRAASAYKKIGVETAVSGASPHQLVKLLLERLLENIRTARLALKQGNVAVKCAQISHAVRILDEGLKPALNLKDGGDIAANLDGLYGFCVMRLTHANMHNDDVALSDVQRVIEPVAQGWAQIGDQVPA